MVNNLMFKGKVGLFYYLVIIVVVKFCSCNCNYYELATITFMEKKKKCVYGSHSHTVIILL